MSSRYGLVGLVKDPTIVGDSNRYAMSNFDPEEANAQLVRQEEQRYESTYAPLEDYLFQSLGNWQGLVEQEQRIAMEGIGRQFDKSMGQTERRNRSYGIEQTPEQKAALRRQYDIAAATSAVNAANTTAKTLQDTRYGLVGGFSPYRTGG